MILIQHLRHKIFIFQNVSFAILHYSFKIKYSSGCLFLPNCLFSPFSNSTRQMHLKISRCSASFAV